MTEVPKNWKGISAFPREQVRRHPGVGQNQGKARIHCSTLFLFNDRAAFLSTNLRLCPYVAPDEGPFTETLLS